MPSPLEIIHEAEALPVEDRTLVIESLLRTLNQIDPSIKLSLTFLRKTPWAREKVERWFVADCRRKRRGRS